MYDLIFRVSSLALVYGALAIIALAIRAALRAKRESGCAGHAASHHALKAKPDADPYYQAVCHHSRPLHLTK